MDGHINGWTYRRTDIQTDRQTVLWSVIRPIWTLGRPNGQWYHDSLFSTVFKMALRMDRQTDGRMDGRMDGWTDKGTDQSSSTRLQVFVSLPIGFGTYFFDLSNTAVFTIFPFKITSDPCPLRILILHGKCENEKSKNIGTWQIQLPRCPCFSKCKNVCIFLDLKF